MTAGLFLLSGVTIHTAQTTVATDLVLIGAGIGMTMPLYVSAVMNALPQQYLGVASSQTQFWRNIGSTVGVSILGAVLAHQLPVKVEHALADLHPPPGMQSALPPGSSALPSGGNAQALFDTGHIAAVRAALPPPARERYDQAIVAVRGALAESLRTVFSVAAWVGLLAVLLSLALVEVPLRSRMKPPQPAPASPD